MTRGEVLRYTACLHERRPVRIVDDADGAAELRLHLLRPFLATGATRVAMHQDGTCSESPRRGSARQRGGEKAKAIHI
ncbi:hypothetical protein GCM10011380_34250 [Sphingomonas metalli]|uniref:Uncharacterized protein n=1 Tax=Sphingomonas metalli TaxID=1779358 RepID=A0A916WZ40_9SPHN|nr:hypothetical protein GCM10011380_34250 [Sphingomonas metalli]